MPPVCCICQDNKTEYETRCETCKKCLCGSCYNSLNRVEITWRTVVVNKCPFCNHINKKELDELNKDSLIKIIGDISEQNILYDEKIITLHKDIQKLKDYIKTLFDKITLSKIIIFQNICIHFESKNRKTIKITELKNMIDNL